MPSVSDEHVEQVKDILEDRRGVENSITSAEIRDELSIQENETTPKTRAIITHLVKEEGIPIAAKTGGPNAGYFIIDSEDELYNYLGTLSSRAASIEDRHKSILEAAQEADHITVTPDEFDQDLF